MIPVEIEFTGGYELFQLSLKSALIEALERGLLRGSEEEGIATHEVGGGDVEANWLHDVPRKLPEGEPHEQGRLSHQVAQPHPQLPSYKRVRLLLYHPFLLLQGIQLVSSRVVGAQRQRK